MRMVRGPVQSCPNERGTDHIRHYLRVFLCLVITALWRGCGRARDGSFHLLGLIPLDLPYPPLLVTGTSERLSSNHGVNSWAKERDLDCIQLRDFASIHLNM